MSSRVLKVRLGADLSEFEKAMVTAAKITEKLGKDMRAAGESLTKVVSAPLAALGAAAVAASEGIDDAMDRIRSGTGATGDKLDELGASFKSVFSSVPADAATVATAITELSTRTGASGAALEGLATQVIQLSKVSGAELAPLVGSATTLFKNWEISTEDQTAALDRLWKISQETGVEVGTLAEQLSQGGATLRTLGMDFTSAADVVGQFAEIGVDAGSAMAGLTKAATELAKNGGDIKAGFTDAVTAIKDAEDPAIAAAKAVDLFGKSGVAMADAIRRGGFDVQAFASKINSSKETIARAAADTAGLGESFQRLRNQVQLALEPIGVAVTRVLITLMDQMASIAQSVGQVTQAFASLPVGVQTAVVTLAAIAAAAGPVLIALGGTAIGVAGLVKSLIELKAVGIPALSALTGLFASSGAAAAGTGAAMATAGTSVASAGAAVGGASVAVGVFGRAVAALSGPVGIGIGALTLLALNWDRVKAAARAAADGVLSVWADAKTKIGSALSPIAEAIREFLKPATDALGEIGAKLAESAKGIGERVWDAIKGPIERVQQFASAAWDRVGSGAKAAVQQVRAALDSIKAAPGDASDFLNRKGLADRGFTTMGDGAQITGKGQWALSDRGEWVPWSPGAREGATPRTQEMIPGGRSNGARDIIVGPGGATNSTGGVSREGAARDISIGSGMNYGGASLRGAGVDRSYDGAFKTPGYQNPVQRFDSAYKQQQDSYRQVLDSFTSRYNLPRLAEGGIIANGPQLALIGEAGPEAVVPLSKMGSMGGGGGGAPVVVVINVNGSIATQKDIADEIRKDLIRSRQRTGAADL